ncbi:MAG: RtcB family protein [Pirellulaceae bacterium]|nr:RtcB family protein [Pirellulaceae bacterium]
MNRRQLTKLGVPEDCMSRAIQAVQRAVSSGELKGQAVKQKVKQVLNAPRLFVGDSCFGDFASELIAEGSRPQVDEIKYRTWGSSIDEAAHAQMRSACQVPCAVGAAMMPDAHVGYGLPIGGVLACEGGVIPYAVGVDIACRMKLSVLDMPPRALKSRFSLFRDSLERGTRFGVGCKYNKPQGHAVMDQDWSITKVTRENKDKAARQLGTSGSGNHFVEFGVLTLNQKDDELGLEAGQYVALLSHSGSRGSGASVCSTYSSIAQSQLPSRYQKLNRLAWLDLDSEAGQEYWLAMNLMGDYAAANHAVIHRNVTQLLGANVMGGVENHHNFAWKERHHGQEVIVHRKGATPAAVGDLGVIPGSMQDPAFVVRGKGNQHSFRSAAHGAGRQMSRRKAKAKFNLQAVKNELAEQGIHVISAGADEVPAVYKDILQVMHEQQDLVEVVARFDPRIVKMCGDGSRAED